ncbi:MAG: molybdenum cofactor carrier [Candidatus Hydrogenedentes bacterium]|jgi:predicted Rossmann-fold nucleotide-binding protein|nr:putative molybdenum carrier protein [Candidatus Hydrogenedentota bacterium]NLT61897.1 molybdenum cofactor carrier [Candidatus Hydrogenedentota bacterium]HNV20653.1 putative molybdenum carrier protein [Candidatus Hydrogenedentota bacterium]HNZ17312.1 putative molybdenum carrier protein [Candidatus Hydrogenedentota bacterium]HOH33016.1 putative molybdenum carrier protein [Candidatus Hydrogenedentota bacterium]
MQIRRVVTGGQTGVDRAALDVAMRLGIGCGGWCPRGRLAEDGPLPANYPLKETPTPVYAERTEWNVRDSDGTLVLTWGPPADGTAFTVDMARKHGRPVLVIDLEAREARFEQVHTWLLENGIRTLNVAGPRESKCPGIYEDASAFLEALLSRL